MEYDATTNQHGLPHDPFLSCIVPRPIGWITSQDRNGTVNLAPFSFFNGVGVSPPQVMFCTIGEHADGGPKDSVKNVEETGEFVVNVVSWELREQMNLTSAYVERGVNEAELARLEMESSRWVKPPRVKASPIHLECRYLMTLRLPWTNPAASSAVVIGTVVGVHIKDEVLKDGLVDITKVRPVARLGYMEYAVIAEAFTMRRPTIGGTGFHLNRT